MHKLAFFVAWPGSPRRDRGSGCERHAGSK